MQIDDFLQAPRLQSLRNQAESSQSDLDKRRFLSALVAEIVKKLGDVTVSNLDNGINVNNLDQIKAHLRNELIPVIKSINNGSDRTDIIKAIKSLSDEIKKIDFNPTINIESPDVKVPEFIVPEVKIPDINIPTPQVTVNVPDVIIPEFNIPTPIVHVSSPVVNIPEINLEEVINELSIGLKKLRQNNTSNPIFVRITDLDRVLLKLDEVRVASKEVMLGFPGSIRIQNATGGVVDFNQIGSSVPSGVGSGKTVVTTAGTRVVLATSKIIQSVTVKALSINTGFMYVGNSSVSSTNGFQLKAGESVSLNISNLVSISIDSSVNGEGVTYMWVS